MLFLSRVLWILKSEGDALPDHHITFPTFKLAAWDPRAVPAAIFDCFGAIECSDVDDVGRQMTVCHSLRVPPVRQTCKALSLQLRH